MNEIYGHFENDTIAEVLSQSRVEFKCVESIYLSKDEDVLKIGSQSQGQLNKKWPYDLGHSKCTKIVALSR